MTNLALLGAMKLSIYIAKNYSLKVVERYENILIRLDEAVSAIEDEEALLQDFISENNRLLPLIESAQGNAICLNLLYLCALKYLRPEYGPVLDLISDDNDEGISLKTATSIAAVVDDYAPDMQDISKAYELMELILLASHTKTDILKEYFRWDDRLTAFLDGNIYLDRELKEECEEFSLDDEYEVPIYGYKDQADEIAAEINSIAQKEDGLFSRGYLRFIISGQKGSGRYTHAKYIAKKCDTGLLSVRYSALVSSAEMIRKVIRECYLSGYSLCIRDIIKDDNTELFIRKIQEHFSHYIGRGILFLLTDENVKLVPLMTGAFMSHKVEPPSGEVAEELWKAFFEEQGVEGYDISALSGILSMNSGQIKKLAIALSTCEETQGRKLNDREVYKLSYGILDDGRYENVHRVEPGYTLADLKVDDKKKKVLQEICDQVRFRRKVYDTWGMREKYAYGRCVSILLAGPPGTGKTMAVHAIANELGLEMYKVDLSQVVDKYIGETEKRLEEVFKRAEKSNMILFFDEADAVMGKRTSTNDSHDKYSNTQIAFILQRIEEYDGIVVLATNLVNNIDNAFMRRIKYAITFDQPLSDTRLSIWKSAFSDRVPLSDDIDFEYLAGTFEISGAIIKNIVLNATFFAASEDVPVNMEHIMRAVLRESNKDKSIISTAPLGQYEYLLRE